MKNFLSCTIVFCLFFMLACEDNTTQPIKKTSDQPQSPTSLDGTVWVHHPDTDPLSENWVSIGMRPRTTETDEFWNSQWPNGFNPEMWFTDHNINSHGEWFVNPPYIFPYEKHSVYYHYVHPNIWISNSVSFSYLIDNFNICYPTYDKPSCDCTFPYPYANSINRCCALYWMIGKVEGNTMYLRKFFGGENPSIERDVILVRVDNNGNNS